MTKRSAWFSLRGSLWFVPLLLLIFGAIAALGFVQLDLHLGERLRGKWPVMLEAGPDGARQILSAIASSMITVAGVVFSITIVALSLSANQYSPRVLRNFMRDPLNQTVLGVFVAVFVYSLLVLQSIRSGQELFVPQLALWIGVLLVIISIGFLIAFIHHTAASIQASEIVARIAKETLEALGAARRIANKGGSIFSECNDLARLQWLSIPSCESGYVQDVDVQKLFDLACRQQFVLRVECPVGEFVVAGSPLVSVSGTIAPDKALIKKIQRLFGINSYRTIEQDPSFGVRQIVDIALKALSPGINDTTTAIHCVDYLGVILRAATHVTVSPQVHREQSAPRLVLRQHGPEHLTDVALHEIRQNARGNMAILLRLLRLLRQLREVTENPRLRKHLRNHALLVARAAERDVPEPDDLARVAQALEKTLSAMPNTEMSRL